MENEEIQEALELAEQLCAKVYAMLSEDEKENDALVLALIWVAVAIGLRSDIEPSILSAIVSFATESALEDTRFPHKTLH
tara:strand:- start:461 stop:700 length:240 start_codon:yes stop_codon:yes gene_type:complete